MTFSDDTIREARDLITSGRQFLIVLPPAPSSEHLFAAVALFLTLRAQEKQATLLTPLPAASRTMLPAEWITALTNTHTQREFIIMLDTRTTPIKELRYEKEDDQLAIILTPQAHALTPDVISYKEGNLHADLIIALGIFDRAIITSPLPAAPIINIDTRDENTNWGTINIVSSEQLLGEVLSVLLHAADTNSVMSRDATTSLLASILAETAQFTKTHITTQTFKTVALLMHEGADWHRGISLVSPVSSLGVYQLYGRALVRSKINDTQNSVFCFLTQEDFEKTGRGTDDTKAVIRHLMQTFSRQSACVLFWQTPDGISAFLYAQNSSLERIRPHLPNHIMVAADLIYLKDVFPSFQDAEDHFHSLLQPLSEKF